MGWRRWQAANFCACLRADLSNLKKQKRVEKRTHLWMTTLFYYDLFTDLMSISVSWLVSTALLGQSVVTWVKRFLIEDRGEPLFFLSRFNSVFCKTNPESKYKRNSHQTFWQKIRWWWCSRKRTALFSWKLKGTLTTEMKMINNIGLVGINTPLLFALQIFKNAGETVICWTCCCLTVLDAD